MNARDLTKLYDRLKPCERVPLIIAAARRHDDAERLRLSEAAPKFCVRLPDFFPSALALTESAEFHRITLLDLAARLWQAWGIWGWCAAADKEPEDLVRQSGLAQYFAYEFSVHTQAWEAFCAELHVEPDALLDCYPGHDIIVQTREQAKDMAYDFEGATIFLRLCGQDTELPPTVTGIAQALRVMYRERMAWWDGSNS